MITLTQWQCPPGLIQRALTECPIDGNRTALNTKTGDDFYDEWKLKDEFKSTPWEELLNTLPYTIGEARVITLEPGCSYMAHADIDNRWHLNLSGNQSYLTDLSNQQLYKQSPDNRWRYMLADRIHTASNFGSIPRKQLVVRELLQRSKFKNMIAITITPAYEQFDYRYQFDTIVSPWLNLKNQDGTLTDFVYKGELVSFKIAEHIKHELQELFSFSGTRFNVQYV
jgi:hypothetical protein